jgi:cobalamin biosynthesis Co2+ chelatase CbiK
MWERKQPGPATRRTQGCARATAACIAEDAAVGTRAADGQPVRAQSLESAGIEVTVTASGLGEVNTEEAQSTSLLDWT